MIGGTGETSSRFYRKEDSFLQQEDFQMLTDFVTGYDHVGIPTNDMEATTKFYETIGFKLAHENTNNGGKVRFFQYGDIIIETYEVFGKAAMVRGAIDHIALRVTDIEKCYEEAKAAGLDVFEGPCFLPFWENGIKYICIMGPNNEVVEFLQKM